MALVTEVTKRVDIPGEPEQWLQIRKLSWRKLEQASDVQTDVQFARIKRIGRDALAAVRSSTEGQQIDPNTAYDQGEVLKLGIVAWSYDAPLTAENLDALDANTADWAFGEIMSLSKPRTEAETKNA